MNRLTKLAEATKCDFHLEFNPHKSLYETAEQHFIPMVDDFYDTVGEIDYSKDIWTIQVYPRTPVGFIAAISNNLDALLDWAIDGAKEY